MSDIDSALKSALKNFSVLVVDDDAMVRQVLVQYLVKFGFANILQAKDGEYALKFVQNQNERIDLVISDWEMPRMDGLTLLKAIRKHPRRQNVRFMMVTSQGSRERMKISQAARWRVDAYLMKPFNGEVLLDKLVSLLPIQDQKKGA